MADFNYTGSGVIDLVGCGKSIKAKFFEIAFDIGDTAYLLEQANKGELEKIVIKKYFIKYRNVIYQDTFNSVYEERELVPHSTAVSIALAYYNNLAIKLENYIKTHC